MIGQRDRRVHLLSIGIANGFMTALREKGVAVSRAKHRGGTIIVGKSLTVAIGMALQAASPVHGRSQWWVCTNRKNAPDYTIVALLDPDHTRAERVFFLPRSEVKRFRMCIGDHNLSDLERHQCPSMEDLVERALSAAAVRDCAEALSGGNARRRVIVGRGAVRHAQRSNHR